jgi:hypothetical protein
MLYVKNMGQLDKNDLAQMNEDYFKSLAQERLVEVAKSLHQLATELWEKQQQNSTNSSQPPSKNNPYTSLPKKEEESSRRDSLSKPDQTGQNQIEERFEAKSRTKSSRKPGKQPGAKGSDGSKP